MLQLHQQYVLSTIKSFVVSYQRFRLVIILQQEMFWELDMLDDVIRWKHFPRYWPFVRGIHRWPVTSPCKGQWRGALVFSLICAWINDWVNSREAGDSRRHQAQYDVTVMWQKSGIKNQDCLIQQKCLSKDIETISYVQIIDRIFKFISNRFVFHILFIK